MTLVWMLPSPAWPKQASCSPCFFCNVAANLKSASNFPRGTTTSSFNFVRPVVFAGRELSFGAVFEELGKLLRVHVGHSQIHGDLTGVTARQRSEVRQVRLAMLRIRAARHNAGQTPTFGAPQFPLG